MSGIIRSPPSEDDGDDEPDLELPDATPEEAYHRGRLYSLISFGFERPGRDHEEVIPERFIEDLRESAAALDDPALEGAVEALADCDRDMDTVHSDWASLFGVEEGVTVSPYELTYLPGPLVTTSRDLADIAGFYDAFDLSVAEGKNDRVDHVCFQTEFLGNISMREAVLREQGDEQGIEVVVDARRQFVEDHLGRWFWRLTDEISVRDDGFYAALGDLLAALMEAEVETLDVDPDWVPDDPEVAEWTEDIFGDAGRGCGGCGVGEDGRDIPQDADIPTGPPEPPSRPE